MSATQYVHAKSDQTDWNFVPENLLLGNAFDSVWCRQLIAELPNVWQVKLTSGQELPSHSFGSTVAQIMTYGSVSIEGEYDCDSER
ncbi:MAG: hypothetical protein P8J86_10040 [Phycisphaerales bacterium]|nr:hypothetical protein [Phycisphaerales bacterium]